MKTVIITGATSGIGLELVKLFEKNKIHVIKISRSLNNPEFDEYGCDVSNFDEVVSTFELIAKKHKHIDLLINSAGFGLFGATEFLPIEECKKQFEVNFFGALYCSKCVLPLMTSTSKIINISSACALFSLPFRSLYSASKAALNSLTFGMRNELKNSGICVSSICPGDIKTNFTKNRVKYFDTNIRYGNQVENSSNFMDSKNSSRMSAGYASNKIFKICSKRKTKAMYIVGFKYKIFNFLYRIFPTSWFYDVIHKIFVK